jgi:hypothetical protein
MSLTHSWLKLKSNSMSIYVAQCVYYVISLFIAFQCSILSVWEQCIHIYGMLGRHSP